MRTRRVGLDYCRIWGSWRRSPSQADDALQARISSRKEQLSGVELTSARGGGPERGAPDGAVGRLHSHADLACAKSVIVASDGDASAGPDWPGSVRVVSGAATCRFRAAHIRKDGFRKGY